MANVTNKTRIKKKQKTMECHSLVSKMCCPVLDCMQSWQSLEQYNRQYNRPCPEVHHVILQGSPSVAGYFLMENNNLQIA